MWGLVPASAPPFVTSASLGGPLTLGFKEVQETNFLTQKHRMATRLSPPLRPSVLSLCPLLQPSAHIAYRITGAEVKDGVLAPSSFKLTLSKPR